MHKIISEWIISTRTLLFLFFGKNSIQEGNFQFKNFNFTLKMFDYYVVFNDYWKYSIGFDKNDCEKNKTFDKNVSQLFCLFFNIFNTFV